MSNNAGQLRELFRATGGPFGSITVDEAFKVKQVVLAFLDNLTECLFPLAPTIIIHIYEMFYAEGTLGRNIWSGTNQAVSAKASRRFRGSYDCI